MIAYSEIYQSDTLLLFQMPKLVRKPKQHAIVETEKESKDVNNNNEHKEAHGSNITTDHQQPTYEELNPRYAKDAHFLQLESEETSASLNDKIRYRLGNYIEEPWTIIGSYFEGKHLEQLVRHQIESYNDMINVQLKRTVDMFNPVKK